VSICDGTTHVQTGHKSQADGTRPSPAPRIATRLPPLRFLSFSDPFTRQPHAEARAAGSSASTMKAVLAGPPRRARSRAADGERPRLDGRSGGRRRKRRRHRPTALGRARIGVAVAVCCAHTKRVAAGGEASAHVVDPHELHDRVCGFGIEGAASPFRHANMAGVPQVALFHLTSGEPNSPARTRGTCPSFATASTISRTL
jgi:hypothetical protein